MMWTVKLNHIVESMNSFHSAGAEAPPKYDTLENRRATPACNHSDCPEPSNESYLSPEQRSHSMILGSCMQGRDSTIAVPCLWSCSKRSRASLPSRTWRSTIRAYCKAWLDRIRQGCRFRDNNDAFTVSLGPRLAMDGRLLEIGKREISVGPEHDWTTEWEWVLKIRAYTQPEKASCSNWSVDICIFFRDLPLLLSTGGISWDSAHVHQSDFRYCKNTDPDRARPWVQYSTYTPKVSSTRWRAEAVHRSRHLPLDLKGLVSLLSAETVYQ